MNINKYFLKINSLRVNDQFNMLKAYIYIYIYIYVRMHVCECV